MLSKNELLAIGGFALLIVIGLMGFTIDRLITSYGDSRERSGILSQTNTQLGTDNAALIAQAQTMVDSFNEAKEHSIDMVKTADGSVAAPSIQSTADKLCAYRSANGVQCPPSPAPRKPVQQ